jgi:gamma-glutamyltranspeptidase
MLNLNLGLGGGGFLIARDKDGQTKAIDFREVAPDAASENMYKDNPKESQIGGLAIGVPGEIRGFQKAHELYGKLQWQELFKPSIKLARQGFVVTRELARLMELYKTLILSNPSYRHEFAPDGRLLKEGEILTRQALADTLEAIAIEGPDVFYKVNLTGEVTHDSKVCLKGIHIRPLSRRDYREWRNCD